MANRLPVWTGNHRDLDSRIPQRVLMKKVSADLDADYERSLVMSLRHSDRDMFDWLFEKGIEVRWEKFHQPDTWQQIFVATALFETRTDLMECLMKFDIKPEVT